MEKRKDSRIAALDYGMARIGIALSDPSKLIASPLHTITTDKRSEATAAKVLQELERHQQAHGYQLEEIVVGLPLMMSGKSGLIADEVRHFVELLRKLTSIPIVLWDERLTSVQADRSMREGQLSRKRRARSVDAVAAVILLQSYLDHKGFRSTLPEQGER